MNNTQSDDDFDLDDDADWEDDLAYSEILAMLPDGWTLIKVSGYHYQSLMKLDDWLAETCLKAYRKVNWSGGCSYSTGIMLECPYDATLVQLRWS